MGIQKAVKNFGKSFIGLKQEGERIISQAILIVDNGYSWIGYLDSALKKTRDHFPVADISVLTCADRKAGLEKDFPGIRFVLPSQRLWPDKYRIALEMLRLKKERYDYIILLSLDITPLIAGLCFSNSKVILFNQWEQWWSLGLRRVGEIFKRTYSGRRTRRGLKGFLKKAGLFFVLVQRRDEELFRHSVLIVDHGHISFQHIDCIVQRVKDILPHASAAVLALEERKELKAKLPDLRIIQAGGCLIKRYQVARHMLRLRKNRYDYIILLSLDITPMIASILFMKGRVILFNRWQQWWSFRRRSIGGYLKVIPLFILNIIIFIYLLISVSWIFLKRSFNVSMFSLLKGGH